MDEDFLTSIELEVEAASGPFDLNLIVHLVSGHDEGFGLPHPIRQVWADFL